MLITVFNLQIFATETTNTLSAEMKTFYDKTLILTAEPALVHMQFGQKRPIPTGEGKTVNFRRFSALPKASKLVEGVTPEGNKLNVTTVTATVDQYGDYIEISDMLDLTAVDKVVLEATKLLGNQGGLTLDTAVRNVIVGGTNVLYANGASRSALTSNDKLTTAKVFEAAAILKAANAPKIDGYYVAFIHPYVAYDLMQEAGGAWLEVNKYADAEKIFKGEIGKLGGVRFIETSEAKIFYGEEDGCAADTAVFATMFVGEGAYGVTELEGGGMEIIVKQLGYGNDPLNQRSSVGFKATLTASRLADEFMVRLESGSALGGTVKKAN
jgi:N4-gp56 family major capsid protein